MKDIDGADNLQFDLYEDCILLMDEGQFARNRHWMETDSGQLYTQEWTVLMLPTAGSIQLEIAGEAYTCSVGQVMVAMLQNGIAVGEMTADFSAYIIGMNFQFVNGLNISDALSSGLAVQRQPIIGITGQIHQAIVFIFEQLRGIIAADDNPYRFRAVQLLVETYYHSIGYYLHRDADTRRRTGSEALADQFLHMVKRDFHQHRDLDHYAGALCVSKKHLSATVAKVTGMPASHWIEHSVVLFAKQQLTHSSLSVGQIADELHFANQSHFGTYFKRATGQSPDAYRRGARVGGGNGAAV